MGKKKYVAIHTNTKASATYLASEHQRQRVGRAGNFAMAQHRSALRAFHYRRHSWRRLKGGLKKEKEKDKPLCSNTVAAGEKSNATQEKGDAHGPARPLPSALSAL